MKGLVLACLFALACAKHEQYIGWKSYYITTSTAEQQKHFGSLVDALDLDVLSPPLIQREGVVLVQPQNQALFTKTLENQGIKYRIHVEDLKAALDVDDILIEARRNATRHRNADGKFSFDNYQELEVIDAYLDEIAREHSDIVTLVSPANSFEGRPLKYLKISTTNFQDQSKPVIFIDGGIHAREWISPPTVIYAIKKLVEDRSEPDLLERFDWILMPMVNPDGYKFSFTSRMWRKTRSTDQHSWSNICPGVDGNRNYDFFWDTVGTSSTPCSDVYAGSKPFSEVETRVVRDIILENLHRMAMYLTMHSYGSMFLYPWGNDGSLSNNAFALHTVGVAMAATIDSLSLSNFPRYVVGNSVLVIGYPTSGASEDYAHLVGVPLSYTCELPGLGFTAQQAFHLDPQYIEQVCMETWAGIAVGARMAGDLFVPLPYRK